MDGTSDETVRDGTAVAGGGDPVGDGTARPGGVRPSAGRAPTLAVTVEGVSAPRYTAVPTLEFRLRVASDGDVPIQCVALQVQLRVAAPRRTYDPGTRERLADLFGAPAEWGRTLRGLLWTQANVQVPAFTGSTVVGLPVGCTYDFEVAVAKYFHGVPDGEIPLEFLCNGTVFYQDGDRLQVTHLPWDTDAEFRMPVRAWQEAVDRHFPGTAWLRVDREVFDRLYAYRVRRVLPRWEDALTELLEAGGG